MPEYLVSPIITQKIKKPLKIRARDEEAAKERAQQICEAWDGVEDVEVRDEDIEVVDEVA